MISPNLPRPQRRKGLYVNVTRLPGGTVRPVPDERWTALNIRTEARYQACLGNGGHHPGRHQVMRPPHLVPLRVCSRCGVPLPAKVRRVVLGRLIEVQA
jgi:hypothetical protein